MGTNFSTQPTPTKSQNTMNARLNKISELINNPISSTNLYFISRTIKDGATKSTRSIDKFEFSTNSVDISSELVEFFMNSAKKQLQKSSSSESGYSFEEYSIISDDTPDTIYTYTLNNELSFSPVIEDQIPSGGSKQIKSLKEVSENLWAYCIKISSPDGFAYFFRKISSGKVATDEPRNKREKISSIFDAASSELKIVLQETVTFDDKLDCIFDEKGFLIFRKSSFEAIVGLEQEFTENANSVLHEIKKSQLIEGIEYIEDELGKSKQLLKSLSSIAKKGAHTSFNKDELIKMKEVHKKFNGDDLKLTDDDRILIENQKDVSSFVRLLNDYYKQGLITGKFYGTNSGSVLPPSD